MLDDLMPRNKTALRLCCRLIESHRRISNRAQRGHNRQLDGKFIALGNTKLVSAGSWALHEWISPRCSKTCIAEFRSVFGQWKSRFFHFSRSVFALRRLLERSFMNFLLFPRSEPVCATRDARNGKSRRTYVQCLVLNDKLSVSRYKNIRSVPKDLNAGQSVDLETIRESNKNF